MDELQQLSKPVNETQESAQVGTMAAHGDQVIGDLIAEAMEKVGTDGVITVEEAKAIETSLEVVAGMPFDRGDVSPDFVTHPDTREAGLEEPYLLIADKKIAVMRDLRPLLAKIAQAGTPRRIIAEEGEGAALATLVVKQRRGGLPCAAVKAPGDGDGRKAMWEDIALLTGGR